MQAKEKSLSQLTTAQWQTEHDFAHPVVWLASDPKDPKTLYASVLHHTTGGIFVTHNADAGANSTWTKLANPPRTEGHPFNIRILKDGSLLASYSGRRTSNFTASSGVFFSTDAGATWADRSDNGMKYWTKDVVVDPYDPTENTWYAGVFSGWGGQANNLGGLYMTTNRGSSWIRIKTSDGITSVTFSPSDPNVMYITSETTGLWYCNNRSSKNPTYTQVAVYPFRQPERVFFNPFDTNEVWVSSFGNGMKVGSFVVPQKPAAVILQAPKNDSTGVPIKPTLQWKASSFATYYQVQICPDSTFPSALIQDAIDSELSYQPLNILPDTRYYWRVQAYNNEGSSAWSETWHFNTIATPSLSTTLAWPANEAKDVDTAAVTFTWNPTAGAKSYQFQLSTDSIFNTVLIDSSGIIATSFGKVNLQRQRHYSWRVRASNETATGPWSEVWSFTTTPNLPVKVTLRYPPNGATNIPLSDSLVWDEVPEAISYIVQISHHQDFSDTLQNGLVILKHKTTFSQLDPVKTYYWRIYATNYAGKGPSSDVWSFTTVAGNGVSGATNVTVSIGNYPNPFSEKTTISYSLDRSAVVSLKLFDLLGREISTLTSGFTDAGNHSLTFDGSSLANGAYILRLEANGKTTSQIINIVK